MSTTYAASFNGSSDYMINYDSSLDLAGGSFCIIAWIKTTEMSANHVVLTRDDTGGQRQYGFWINAGKIHFETISGGSYYLVDDTNTLNAGWNLCAVWHDSADGLGRASLNTLSPTVSSSPVTPVTVSVSTVMGQRGGFFFDGSIDGLAIIKGYAPTSGDLTWLYNSGAGRSFSDWPANVASLYAATLAYFTFDDSGNLGLDTLGLHNFENHGAIQSTSGIVDPVGAPESTASSSGSGTASGSGTSSSAPVSGYIGDAIAPILILKRRAATNVSVPHAAGNAIVSGVSVAQPWNPSMLSSLVAWYKADDGCYSDAGVTPCADGTTVYQWNDFSSNHYNLTQTTSGNRPTYRINQIAPNGMPAVTFAGSHAIFTDSMPRLLNFTFAMIWVDDLFASNYYIPIGHQDGNDTTRNFALYIKPAPDNNAVVSINGVGDCVDHTAFSTGQTLINVGTYDNVNIISYSGGSTTPTASLRVTGDPPDPSGGFTLGALNSRMDFPITGRIAEVAVFSQALVDGDLINLSSYLISRIEQINPSTATDGGLGTASAVGGSLDVATASASGSEIVSGIGAPVFVATASASGSADVNAAGRSVEPQAGVASDGGSGSASGVGISQDVTTASDVGIGMASAVSQSSNIATASATGSGAVSSVGMGFIIGTASDLGSASITGVGGSRDVATASVTGIGSDSGVGGSLNLATGSDVGSGIVTGSGQSNSIATASATGIGTVTGSGRMVSQNSGVALDGGLGEALGVGHSLNLVTASDTGSGIAFGAGISLNPVTASGSGSAIVEGFQFTYLFSIGTGTASGNSVDIGSSKELATSMASDVGQATATGSGMWVATFAVSALGSATATGSGALALMAVANDGGLGSVFGAGIGPSAASDGGSSVSVGVGHSLFKVIASAHGSSLIAGFDANWHGSGWLGADFNLF